MRGIWAADSTILPVNRAVRRFGIGIKTLDVICRLVTSEQVRRTGSTLSNIRKNLDLEPMQGIFTLNLIGRLLTVLTSYNCNLVKKINGLDWILFLSSHSRLNPAFGYSAAGFITLRFTDKYVLRRNND